MTLKATVWVCPGCLSYYASSSVGDLRTEMNKDAKGKPTFPRSRCGHCGIDRVPHRVKIEIGPGNA
jgi:hypothetical protein